MGERIYVFLENREDITRIFSVFFILDDFLQIKYR